MAKILVLSDTHWNDAQQFNRRLEGLCLGVDLILHAGDAVDSFVHEKLRQWAPVHAVLGNCDRHHLRSVCQDRLEFEFEGVRFGMFHGHRANLLLPDHIASFFSPKTQFIIHGHSHIAADYLLDRNTHRTRAADHDEPFPCDGQVRIFNPGSFSEPRDQRPPSWGELWVEDGQLKAQHLFL